APAVGARSRLVVREVVPRGAVRAVVLANGAPLAFAEVRTPLAPGNPALASFVESIGLRVGRHETGAVAERAAYGDRMGPPLARRGTAGGRPGGSGRMPWPCGGGNRHSPATPPAAVSGRFAVSAMARASASVSGFVTTMSPMPSCTSTGFGPGPCGSRRGPARGRGPS